MALQRELGDLYREFGDMYESVKHLGKAQQFGRPKLLLVDLAALAFRSHYALIKRPLTRSDGMNHFRFVWDGQYTAHCFGRYATRLCCLCSRSR